MIMLWSILRSLASKPAANPAGAVRGTGLETGIACFNAQDFAGASRDLSAALDAEPDNFVAAYYLALAAAHSGRLERAQELLEAACARRNDADAHSALGNVYRLQGRAAHRGHAMKGLDWRAR